MYSLQFLYFENMQELPYGCAHIKEESTQIVSYPNEIKKEPVELDQTYRITDAIKEESSDGNDAKDMKNTLQDLREISKLQELDAIDWKKYTGAIDELRESVQVDKHLNEIKEEIDDIFVGDMKVEIEETRTSCSICPEEGDFCPICKKIVHILDKYDSKISNSPRKTMPKNILELRARQSLVPGIFTLRSIPEGVTFGPCEGLETLQTQEGTAWKLVGGKLESKENVGTSNWMKFVNTIDYIDTTATYNLTAFQCKDKLFFRSERRIFKDEELLVNFGEELTVLACRNVKYYRPIVRSEVYVGYPCSTCCLGFETRDFLDEHQQKYHCLQEEKNRQVDVLGVGTCPLCKEKLLDWKGFEQHLYNSCRVYPRRDLWPTLEPVDTRRKCKAARKHKCPLCGHTTEIKRSMTIHMNLHANAYKYKCGECDYRTNIKHNFDLHMDDHRGVKRYKCDRCEFRSNCLQTTKDHALRHDGQKPFKCPTCDYRAIKLQNVRKHYRRHQKKYFECRECEYLTGEIDELRQHELQHAGERYMRDRGGVGGGKQRKKRKRKSK